MKKVSINIPIIYMIMIIVFVLANITVSYYAIRYIKDNNHYKRDFNVAQTKIDSLNNLNEQIIERIQTSLDSIKSFHEEYDTGEYELTYPDSILTFNEIINSNKNGQLALVEIDKIIDNLKNNSRKVVLYNEIGHGNYDFYIKSLDEEPNISPTFGVVTSGYGYRKHPVYKRRIFHKGIDIANDIGTPIYATADGIVIKSSWDAHYGRYIKVKHSGGFETRYAHLSKRLVKAGEIVKAGDIIGEMGNTGVTTGVHLHYEVTRNRKLKNPWKYVNKSYRKSLKRKIA